MTEKTFSEIQIGEHFQPIYKNNARVVFQKFNPIMAEVKEVIDGEETKPKLYYAVGDKILIDMPRLKNERFRLIAF